LPNQSTEEQTTLQRLTDLLVKLGYWDRADPRQITQDFKLEDDLAIDSISRFDIVLNIESQFALAEKIPDMVVYGFVTVGDMVKYIDKHSTVSSLNGRGHTRDVILEKVIEIARDVADDDVAATITETSKIEGCLDSLNKNRLILSLEDEFNLQIPDEEAGEFTTFGTIADYIYNHQE
jgi:acyl carrier protein